MTENANGLVCEMVLSLVMSALHFGHWRRLGGRIPLPGTDPPVPRRKIGIRLFFMIHVVFGACAWLANDSLYRQYNQEATQ